MKAALDCVVLKQGVFDLVFHPYGWIKPEQVVELIDHAVAKHGKKVKFLTFREALERLNKNLLINQPLRAEKGQDQVGAMLLDTNGDGYLDIVINDDQGVHTRNWAPAEGVWRETATIPGLPGRGEKNAILFLPMDNGNVAITYLKAHPLLVRTRLLDIDGDGFGELITPGFESSITPGVAPSPVLHCLLSLRAL